MTCFFMDKFESRMTLRFPGRIRKGSNTVAHGYSLTEQLSVKK